MSMNLYIETKQGDEAELIQTPTWVTNMLLINEKGYCDIIEGKEVLRVVEGYKQYLESYLSHSSREYWDEEDTEYWRDWVKTHKMLIDNFVKNHKVKNLIAKCI